MKHKFKIIDGCDPTIATAINHFSKELTKDHALLSKDKSLSLLIAQHLDLAFTTWQESISNTGPLLIKLSDTDILMHHADELLRNLDGAADRYENPYLSFEHVPTSILSTVQPTFKTIMHMLEAILDPKNQPAYGRLDRVATFIDFSKKTGEFSDCKLISLKLDRIKPSHHEARTTMFWLPEVTHPVGRCRFCDAVSEHEAIRPKLIAKLNALIDIAGPVEKKRFKEVKTHLEVGHAFSITRNQNASNEFCSTHASQKNKSLYNKGRNEINDFDFFLSILHFCTTKKTPAGLYLHDELDPIRDLLDVKRFDPIDMTSETHNYPPLLDLLSTHNYRRFAFFALQKNTTKNHVFKLIDYALAHRRVTNELLEFIKEDFLLEIQEIATLLGLTAEQGLSADLSQFPQWKLSGES